MSSLFTPPEADQEIAPPSVAELLWINHRGTLIGGLGAVVALLLIVLLVLSKNHAATIASETLLNNATNDAALHDVIAKYPKSPAAADAMLLLAASLRDAGKIEESNALYSRFAENFPLSPLAVSGLLGRASNAQVAGKDDSAISSYQQAAVAFPQSYGAPFALFSEARLLTQFGKMDETKKVIQALMSQYPNSVAVQSSGLSLKSPQN